MPARSCWLRLLFLAVDNLLLTNEYFYQLSAYGPTKSWDDAIFRLSDEAGQIHAPHLVVDDWGILNPLLARIATGCRCTSWPRIRTVERNWFTKLVE